MITYILIALSLGLTALVGLTQTKLAPVIVTLALIASIFSVETSKGWPARFEPPRQGIIYAATQGKYVLVGEAKMGSTPRLYQVDWYPPEIEAELKEGVLFYDMDSKPQEGEGEGTGHGSFEDMEKEDFTSLERNIGDKE